MSVRSFEVKLRRSERSVIPLLVSTRRWFASARPIVVKMVIKAAGSFTIISELE